MTPLGNSLSEGWANWCSGKTVRRKLEPGEWGQQALCEIAPVQGLDARSFFRLPKALKLSTRKAHFAVSAARMALEDAGLEGDRNSWLSDRGGALIGTCGSDMDPLEFADPLEGLGLSQAIGAVGTEFADGVLSGVTPLWLIIQLPNMLSAHVAIQLGLSGPNNSPMGDWIAGAEAVGEAYRMILNDEADFLLAGAADSALDAVDLCELAHEGIIAPHGSAFAPAEGACVLVLEERECALRRGGRIYAEMKGFATGLGSLSDEGSESCPSTVAAAMGQAGWSPRDLGALCPADVGCESHDALEQRICSVLEGLRPQPRLLKFKQRLGHALAASGPIDLAFSILSLQESVVETNLLSHDLGLSGLSSAIALTVGGGTVAAQFH